MVKKDPNIWKNPKNNLKKYYFQEQKTKFWRWKKNCAKKCYPLSFRRSILTRSPQSTPFQNPGGGYTERYTRTDGQKSSCLILDVFLLLFLPCFNQICPYLYTSPLLWMVLMLSQFLKNFPFWIFSSSWIWLFFITFYPFLIKKISLNLTLFICV